MQINTTYKSHCTLTVKFCFPL